MADFKLSLNIFGRLDGSFRKAIANATAGLKNIQNTSENVKQAFFDVAQAAGTAMAVRRVAGAAGDVEAQLVRIGNTADMANDQLRALRDRVRETSTETRQSLNSLLSAFEILVSKGMANDTASGMLAAIGRAATATGASVEDLSATVFSLNQNLGVKPEQMADALNMLAVAGNQGAFELKDMAHYFPSLTASAQAFGLKGSEAMATLGAALQVALTGAADPAQAATNFDNFMKAINSDVVKEKFKKHGVNLDKIIADGINNGGNVIENSIAALDKLLGTNEGERATRLGKLFQDGETQKFLRPMLANMDKYKAIKQETLSGNDQIGKSFNRVAETYESTSAAFKNEMEKLQVGIGNAWLPTFKAFLTAITPLVQAIGNFATRFPVATAAITGFVVASLTVLPAIRLMSLVFSASFFPAIKLVIGALRALNIVSLLNPWVLGAALIGTAVVAIITHWEECVQFVSDGWKGLGIIFDQVLEGIRAVASAIAHPIDTIKAALGGVFGGGFNGPSSRTFSVAPADLYRMAPTMQGANNISGALDINITGLPQGARISSRSNAPDMDFNLLRSGPIGQAAN